MIAVINMTPVERFDYWLKAPVAGRYTLLLNSDEKLYGGEETAVLKELVTDEDSLEFPHRLRVTLPPMSVLFYRLDD